MKGRTAHLVNLFYIILFPAFVSIAQADFKPASPVMGDYFKTPPYVASVEKPSVMLIFDNSGSMMEPAYAEGDITYAYESGGTPRCVTAEYGVFDPTYEYYGYFDPTAYYVFNATDSTNEFFELCSGTVCTDDTQTWSGNFLNWATMRKIDVAKKVLTGGTVDTDSNPNLDILEAQPYASLPFLKWYDDSNAVADLNGQTRHMTPFHTPLYCEPAAGVSPQYLQFYEVQMSTVCDGAVTFDRRTEPTLLDHDGVSQFDSRVKVDPALLVDGTVEGVIQQTGDDIRYGLTVFDGYDSDEEYRYNGGDVLRYVGSSTADIVQEINDVYPMGNTPLAETLWTVTGYFQQTTEGTGDTGPYYESNSYTVNDTWDPYHFNTRDIKVPCSEASVILMTDGKPTSDENLPGDDPYNFDSLDDVALFAHTTDLRTETELPGTQSITLYPIFLFDTESDRTLLHNSAINGGFVDRNGDGRPNTLAEELLITDLTQREWDHDDDPSHIPDNYSDASDGKALVRAIQANLASIQRRVASGTAASVISSARGGEGAVYQASFYPSRSDGEGREISWVGDTNALFLDAYGNMREDTNGNNKLDLVEDYVVRMFFDTSDNQTKARRYEDRDGDGKIDSDEDVDGDGCLDYIEIDHDGDGNFDVIEDINGDGDCTDDEDFDGDGNLDVIEEDVDGDGHPDVAEDVDGDGYLDRGEDVLCNNVLDLVETDLDGNGELNGYEDLDGDGHRDTIYEDLDGDCHFDQRDEDLNADGIFDPATEDLDGDGNFDTGEDINHNHVLDPGEDIDNDGVLDRTEDLDGDGHNDWGEDVNCNHSLDLFEDYDGDGNIDVDEDSNNNGILDGTEDIDGDGRLDVREWDIDGDGRADGNEDLDGDCNLDVQEDLDGDGTLDTVNEDGYNGGFFNGRLDQEEGDVDGDGRCDLFEDINLDTDPGCDGGSPKFDTVNEDLDGDGRLDSAEPLVEIVHANYLDYLWSAAEQLTDTTMMAENSPDAYGTSAPERYIFTYIDDDNNGITDSGEVLPFDSATLANNQYFGYFLGTGNSVSDRDINGDNAVDNDDVETLINFIRGRDFPSIPTIRSRQLRIDTNGDDIEDASDDVVTWRLGDIVQSTPTVAQAPPEDYDLLYRSESYRQFKKAYANRRTMVYAGANDGMFHAFNGGFHTENYTDTTTAPPTVIHNKFWRNCFRNASDVRICNDDDSTPELGQEMWAYVPYNLLPHLQWLTRHDYTHVYYNDLQPRIFDAQLWQDAPATDTVHVGGWGTILIGGMRFGGGPIQINADAGTEGTDTRYLRSAYFVLDITDPEQPPALLGEFVVDDYSRFSFTTVFPAVIPIYDTDPSVNEWGNTVPLEWYIILGNGPTNLDGESTQEGQVFVMKLKNYQCNGQGIDCINKTLGTWENKDRADDTDYFVKLEEANSFMGDPVVVDLQLGNPENYDGAFMADAVYFGTVAGNFKDETLDEDIGEDLNNNGGEPDYGEDANGNGVLDVSEDLDNDGVLDPGEDVGGWTGRLHRIVIDDRIASTGPEPTNPDSWMHNLFYDAGQPIIAKPTIGVDNYRNIWVYFGTGRLFDDYDREDQTPMNFYGIMEPRTYPPTLANTPNYSGTMSEPARSQAQLLNTTNVTVFEGDSASSAVVTGTGIAGVNYFSDLERLFNYIPSDPTPEPDRYGWFVDLQTPGERNLGRGVLLGDIMAFTSYTPSADVCSTGGNSSLYAYYYRTGTAYWRSVIGLDYTITRIVDSEEKARVETDADLGPGLALSPNVMVGRDDGSKAFIQTSTGSIEEIKKDNPGIIKSGKTSWKQVE